MKAIYRLKTKTSRVYYKFCVFDLEKSTYRFGNSMRACKDGQPFLIIETLEQTGYGVQLLRKKYALKKVTK